jgi:hypothetical protein
MQFKQHKLVYIIAIVALVVLAVGGGLRYHQKKKTATAEKKATELVALLKANGFRIVDEQRAVDYCVRTFGDDGGELLAHPDSTYLRAQANFLTGTPGALARPTILDDDIFLAEELALRVYRPDKLAEFQQWVADMKFDNTIAN